MGLPLASGSFAAGDSWLHRTDARNKVIGALPPILAVALCTHLQAPVPALLVALGLCRLARLDPRSVLKRMRSVNLFLLLLWLTLPWSTPGPTLIQLGPLAPSRAGMALALLITLKANTIMLLMISLLATVPLPALGHALNRLHVSRKFIFLFLTTCRYLTLIDTEFHRLQRAAALRCFRPATTMHTYRTYGSLIGMTLVRAWDRANRINKGLRMRAFGETFPLLENRHASRTGWVLSTGLMLLALVVFLTDHHFF